MTEWIMNTYPILIAIGSCLHESKKKRSAGYRQGEIGEAKVANEVRQYGNDAVAQTEADVDHNTEDGPVLVTSDLHNCHI